MPVTKLKPSLLALVVCAAVSPAGAVTPAPFVIERDRVLTVDMPARDVTPALESGSLSGKKGLLWKEVVVPKGATPSIRVHVKITQATTTPWQLRVLSEAGGEEEVLQVNPADKELWTVPVSPPAVIEARADEAVQGELSLEIDAYAVQGALAYPQSIYGPDERQPIVSAPKDVRQWGSPVARLRIMLDKGGQASCTGFLVGSDILMTNAHCVSSEREARSTLAEFGADAPGISPKRYRTKGLLWVNPQLDCALIRLDRRAGDAFGTLMLNSRAAKDGSDLVVIQHPGGGTKEVSSTHCNVNRVGIAGRGTQDSDFGHTCDTLGGSSGSPVIDNTRRLVVGLHHLGFVEGAGFVNQAVLTSQLVSALRAANPPFLPDIKITP